MRICFFTITTNPSLDISNIYMTNFNYFDFFHLSKKSAIRTSYKCCGPTEVLPLVSAGECTQQNPTQLLIP